MKKEASEEPRYLIGIDLGTTNCAVAFVDTESEPFRLESFSVVQLVTPNLIENRRTLPSFLSTLSGGSLLPWENEEKVPDERFVAGTYARDFGIKTPAAFIASAKSWLCHPKVDRTAKILPWLGMLPTDEEERPRSAKGRQRFRLSPVDASSFYLAHLRSAWNHAFPLYPIESQEVVLTLPASFDEVARELTIEAARRAGLPRIVLIEEPLAAFYAWMFRHKNRWEEYISPGSKILVCDIGGGTTDLTLIRVERGDHSEIDSQNANANDKIRFHRIAVGDHLILGGDNFDLTLAGHLEERLFAENKLPRNADHRLDARTWGALIRIACQIKERFLSDNPPETQTVAIPRPGSKLIEGSLRLEVSRAEIESILIDGFFPFVPLDSVPKRQRSGLREMGLPFADDPAISRWLAKFLTAHRHTGLTESQQERMRNITGSDLARPDVVLFNGGVFESKEIQRRFVEILRRWFSTPERPWSPIVLDNPELDLAVSRGAACYGLVRRGKETRVGAALARTYYVGVTPSTPEANSETVQMSPSLLEALCIIPAGAEPGTRIVPERTFHLTVGRPVRFPIFASSVRLNDRPGELVAVNHEEIKTLQPIQTVLKTRSASRLAAGTITARLEALLTELGTIELSLVEVTGSGAKGRRGTWKLQFDVRQATQTDVPQTVSHAEQQGILDEAIAQPLLELLESVFGPNNAEASIKPSELNRRLSDASETPRDQWPTTLLRRLGDSLLLWDEGRKKSNAHEARWLNLLGYYCRPGFGATMDDWRIDRLWKQVAGNLVHATPECRTQNWILLRRVASGLSAGQQNTLAEPLLSNVRNLYRQMVEGRGHGPDLDFASQEGAEIWRLLGAMEMLAPEQKQELGDMIIALWDKKRLIPVFDPLCWTLARLGARIPFHAPVNTTLPAHVVEPWIKAILDRPQSPPIALFALSQLARKTDLHGYDIRPALRNRVMDRLASAGREQLLHWVERRQELARDEASEVFGESLPVGLSF